jgi:hypothetical protein
VGLSSPATQEVYTKEGNEGKKKKKERKEKKKNEECEYVTTWTKG